MPLVTPTPLPLFSGTLPDPSDRSTYGSRGRALWAWETLNLAPGINLLASQTLQNAEFSSQMAAQAASVAGFLGEWGDQTGAATMPASVLHNDVFWVLLADVADITAHEPGVSVVWGEFDEAATAADTLFDNTGTGLSATQVQAAIVELLALLAPKIGRISATGSVRFGSRTTAQRETTPQAGDRAWNPDLNGGRGAWETWNGAAWEQEGWVIGAAIASTSGVQIDFNAIPAWVNEVRIELREVSTNGSSNILFQLGTSVGFESSGYYSGSNTVTSTAGFVLFVNSAGTTHTGAAIFRRGPGDLWSCNYNGINVGGSQISGAGYKAMTGQLTRIRLTTAGGSNVFDNGSVHISWRK